MCRLICFVLLSVFQYLIPVASNEGIYIILVPTVIHEDSLVSIAVSTMDFNSREEFQVKLESQSKGKEQTVSRYTKSILQNDTVLLQFKIESLKDVPHQLTVSGPGTKKHKVAVQVLKRSVMILIQTDKPIYKPGDTIKFRVLVLDHDTRPMNNLKSVKVELRDNDGNLINEWPFASLQQGVFQSQIDLASSVTLGEWTLSVFALKNERQQKSFTVAKYVLPLHEIRISNPKRTTLKDNSMVLVVDASYTFGKPMIGTLSIAFVGTNYSSKMKINGRLAIDIPLRDVVDFIYPDEIFWLTVNVTVEETTSGQIYEASKSLPIYKRSHKIELRKSSKYLLSEEPLRCWLTVTDPDGKPLSNPGVVHVNVTSFVKFWFNKHFTLHQIPDVNGDISFTLNSSSTAKQFKLDVVYDGELTIFEISHEAEVDENETPFFQASIMNSHSKVNQSIEVLVQSWFRMELIMYHVISQGQIMASGRVRVENKRSVTFTFNTNFAMVPTARLIIFAVHKAQLWTSVVRFKVEDLNNNVFVNLSTNSTEPGKEMHLTVQSQPGSIVGLLAIDRGILQYGTKHDISKELILDKLGASRKEESEDIWSLGFRVLTNAQEKMELEPRFGFDGWMPEALRPKNQEFIRKKFPETWLWTTMTPADANGLLQIAETVPDTITSWSISAFSINEHSGLGVIDHPVSLNVLKAFFITVTAAYSIVKTETAIVEVFVHNYLEQDLQTTVRVLNNQGDFLFVDHHNVTNLKPMQSQQIMVLSNSVGKVVFKLKPTRSGNLLILIGAECEVSSDAVQYKLRVTPGGLLYVRNEARYIEVEQSSMNFTNIRLEIPRAVTFASVNITFSVEGILLGAALTNLDQLIRLPSGCGEQNMLHLVPSVVALEYMVNTATLKKPVKAKAIDFLTKGYQNQLKYKLFDGSFSVFGQNDGRGSVFLTALTAKVFRYANKHIVIDRAVITDAFRWLKSHQQPNGRFIETGKLYYKALQSHMKDGCSLTAYVLISLLEHKTLAAEYRTVVDKGTSFIGDQANCLSSPYDLALVAYALQLANHPRKDYFIDKFVEYSESDGELRWWNTASTSVETTAYALLIFMNQGLYVMARPIMKWLVSQRYDKGGYDNTQNTFVGLQALAQYSQRMSISRNDYDLTVAYNNGLHRIHMDRESSLNGIQLTLPTNIRSVDVIVQGTGVGVFQIAYQYNLVATDVLPRFMIEKTIQKQSFGASLNICTRFKPKRPFEETNMVMMEVSLPSGYIIVIEQPLKKDDKIRKIETKEDDTHLVLYMEPLLENDPACVNFKAFEKACVLEQVPGWIKVYDYYDPTREALEYFTI